MHESYIQGRQLKKKIFFVCVNFKENNAKKSLKKIIKKNLYKN